MTLYYSDLLTRENVLKISKKYGFSADPLVEKFVMCFEIHKYITQEIKCVTRGGLCMPFHQHGFEVRRMSKDIDLISRQSVDEFELVMNNIPIVRSLSFVWFVFWLVWPYGYFIDRFKDDYRIKFE